MPLVRPRRLRSQQDPQSTFRRAIRAAIFDEVRPVSVYVDKHHPTFIQVHAGRLTLDTNHAPPMITVTRAGRLLQVILSVFFSSRIDFQRPVSAASSSRKESLVAGKLAEISPSRAGLR